MSRVILDGSLPFSVPPAQKQLSAYEALPQYCCFKVYGTPMPALFCNYSASNPP